MAPVTIIFNAQYSVSHVSTENHPLKRVASQVKCPRIGQADFTPLYQADGGGNFLNIFSTDWFSLSSFFSGLSERVSVAIPRKIACFVLASNRSITNVPEV